MTPRAVEQVRLAIDVPDAAALDQVDRHFEEILAVDELDEHRLDRFADEVAALPRSVALRVGAARVRGGDSREGSRGRHSGLTAVRGASPEASGGVERPASFP